MHLRSNAHCIGVEYDHRVAEVVAGGVEKHGGVRGAAGIVVDDAGLAALRLRRSTKGGGGGRGGGGVGHIICSRGGRAPTTRGPWPRRCRSGGRQYRACRGTRQSPSSTALAVGDELLGPEAADVRGEASGRGVPPALRALGEVLGDSVLASAGLGGTCGVAGPVSRMAMSRVVEVPLLPPQDLMPHWAEVEVLGCDLASEEVVAGAPADGLLTDELGGRE
jgi:hypothetical protein